MKQTDGVCDVHRIEGYLEDQLGEEEAAALEEHLSHCETCQQELQDRAADPVTWQHAVEFCQGATSSGAGLLELAVKPVPGVRGVLDSLAPTDDPEMLGRIDDYEISGVVGVGGMGAVLKGFDKSLRRVVAIKVMAPHLAGSGPARIRFQREARAAAAITHDNVIDTYGVSEANGLPYLVMPYARGPSLQKRIDESGPLSPLEVVRIGRQIAAGLAAAHEQGLVHRDIKPANILLNEGIERLWITDFGVARAIDDASMTQTGGIAGTPQYMSPEQARGESVDARSDLFSMGSVLYTACTGRPPFRAEAAYGMLRQITDNEPQPIREINAEIPEWLCSFIRRLMCKDRSGRFQTAAEVAQLLEDYLAHLQQPTFVAEPQLAPGTVTPARKTSPSRPGVASFWQSLQLHRQGIWIMVSLIVLAGLGFAAVVGTQPANITGTWKGESWRDVSLQSSAEATGWYSGSFTSAGGRRGVLHLEWSRLQRRYNGRWRLGEDQSGAITLRLSDGVLRGATSFDAGAASPPEAARLRDFVWRRTTETTKRDTPKTPAEPATSEVVITSPIKGRIARMGERVAENSFIRKGDLIVQILAVQPEKDGKNQQQAEYALTRLEWTLQAAEQKANTYKSQVEGLKRAESQLDASGKAKQNAIEKRIQANRANLESLEATRKIAANHYENQQRLQKLKAVSDATVETAAQELVRATAAIKEAKLPIEAEESDLESLRQQERLRADLAQAKIKDAESSLRISQVTVAKLRKQLDQAKTETAKPTQRVIVLAPFDGVITWVIPLGPAVIKSGDTICHLTPARSASATRGKSGADAGLPVANGMGFRPEIVTAAWRTSRVGDQPVIDAANVAVSLGQRLRAINQKLRTIGFAKDESLKKELELQRMTSIDLLVEKREAARQQLLSQQRLCEMVKQRIKTGEAPASELPPAQVALGETTEEIACVEQLIAYYIKLGKKPLPSAEDDRTLVTTIVQIRLDASRKRLALQQQMSKFAKLRFEQGEGELKSVLQEEQTASRTAADVARLEALLAYYKAPKARLGVPTGTRLEGAAITDEVELLTPPVSGEQRQATIKILEALLDAATVKLEKARSDLQRQTRLSEQGYVSAASLLATRSAFAEQETQVRVLKIRLEYHRQIPLSD